MRAFAVALALLPAQAFAAPRFLRVTVPAGALTSRADAPPVTVSFVDSTGAVIASETSTIGLELGPNPLGAHLTGTLSQPARAGVAIFSGLRLDKSGDGYTLTAFSPGVPDAQSAAFAFTLEEDPHEVLGYGCTSGGASALALLGFGVLLLGKKRGAALLLVLIAGGARAQGESAQIARARALNKQGIDALQDGANERAIVLFEQVRSLVNSPQAIYNLAEAHRRAGHIEQALALYHAYLEAVPDPSKRADVRDFARLEQRRAEVAPAQPQPAQALVPARKPSFFHSPGLYAGGSWYPSDKRVSPDAMLQLELAGGFRVSAGGSLSHHPAARLWLERQLYADDDFTFDVELRGVIASFPGSAVKGGGGGFTMRFPVVPHLDFALGGFLEYLTSGNGNFLSPIVSAGLALHL